MQLVQRLISAAILVSIVGACSDDSPTDPFAPFGLEIALDPSVDTIFVSDTVLPSDKIVLKLSATSFGQSVTTPRGVEWSVADPSVATVDSTGTVHAIGRGSTTVTARVNSERAEASIVIASRVTQLYLTPSTITGFIGDTTQLILTATALDASNLLVPGTAYSFASSDPTVATWARTDTRTV